TYRDRTRENLVESPEQLQQTSEEYRAAWSDKELQIERIMETADGTVIAQMRVSGTHAGTYKSVPATGRRVTTDFCDILRFDGDGRIISEEAYYDDLSRMVQIGAIQLQEND